MQGLTPDGKVLLELCTTIMPFGKYKGRLMADLPTHYLEWFAREGFPKGKLGMQLQTLFVIKTEGLEYLLTPIRRSLNQKSR